LAGIAPTLLHNRVSLPTTGACSFASVAPQVSITGAGNQAVIPTLGTCALAGIAGSVVVTGTENPTTVALSLAGVAPLAVLGEIVSPGTAGLEILSADKIHKAGSLALTGQPVTIFYRDGVLIQNLQATTDQINNYLQCDYSGFRVDVESGLKMTWNKHAVRKKSYESRHPQEYIKYKSNDFSRKGPKKPEQDDTFIEDLYPDGIDGSDL